MLVSPGFKTFRQSTVPVQGCAWQLKYRNSGARKPWRWLMGCYMCEEERGAVANPDIAGVRHWQEGCCLREVAGDPVTSVAFSHAEQVASTHSGSNTEKRRSITRGLK